MRVLCDYQIIVRQKVGGISRYHYELIQHINKLYKDVNVDAMCLFFRNYYFESFYKKKAWKYENKFIRNFSLIINDFYTFIKIIISEVANHGYDVIHITWYKPFYVRPIKKILGKKVRQLL